MARTPTGKIRQTANGVDLVLQRRIPVTGAEVWVALTDPVRTAVWIAKWTGDPGVGSTIQILMTAEEGASAEPATITACEPGRQLGLSWGVGDADWLVEVTLEDGDSSTALTFIHHVDGVQDVADIAAGWEYYLDRLVNVIAGEPFAEWDEYYPAMSGHYQDLKSETF